VKAGRVMDYLVAEKVMEWEQPGSQVPYYSTDIAAAWAAVKHSNGWLHLTCDSSQKQWTAQFMGMDVGVSGSTAPEAICRAALKAVGA